MNYQEIVTRHNNDKVGSVTIGTQNVQLCDHVQVVNGRYHVSALFTDENEASALQAMGAATKKMYNGTKVAYLNEDMLAQAKPIYQDGMTADLIDRLMKAMISLNAGRAVAA